MNVGLIYTMSAIYKVKQVSNQMSKFMAIILRYSGDQLTGCIEVIEAVIHSNQITAFIAISCKLIIDESETL